jgi:hypothetical protein
MKKRVHQLLKKVKYQLKTLYYIRKGYTIDTSELNFFVIFLGNSRSGTTIARSILDRHPNAMISNEVNVLKYLQAGANWKSILGRIKENTKKFRDTPFWTDYSYNIQYEESKFSNKKLKIIGDKKAGKSIELLQAHPQLLAQLIDWSPVPVKVIHCIRHPFDVISTKTRKKPQNITLYKENYFRNERAISAIKNKIGDENYLAIYHENWIHQPSTNLKEVLNFLEIASNERYEKHCYEALYKKINKSRFDVKWSNENILSVEVAAKHCEHLKFYFKNDRMRFND